jgi:peroxiredoxin
VNLNLPTPASSRTRKHQKLVFALVAAGTILISIALLSWLTGVRQVALSEAASLFAPARVNYPAPQLTLTDLRGNTVSLADYRGRVVLVNNWATWCPPCVAEMPELQAYFSAHSGPGFVLVGIEAGDPAVQVADFVRQYALTFPVWLDPQSSSLASFHNWSIPSSYVIDRDGTVRLAWAGPVDRSTLEKYLTPLLEK